MYIHTLKLKLNCVAESQLQFLYPRLLRSVEFCVCWLWTSYFSLWIESLVELTLVGTVTSKRLCVDLPELACQRLELMQ